MRSPVFTFLLAFIALILCGLVGWQISEGNLNTLLGAPPTREGDLLYTNFKPADVHRISLRGNGTYTEFVRDPLMGWQCVHPWPKDRMDPRAAERIIAFTLGTRVVDVIPIEKIDSKQAGFSDGIIDIRIEDASSRPLCKYQLGRRTAWWAENPETKRYEDPTVFIQPRDKSRKDYVYACTGDIHGAFVDGFRYLRDHQPFLFNPNGLERIRIKGQEGELTLASDQPGGVWRIVKPLELSTEKESMKHLIQGLFDLRAVKVYDRSDVTLPTGEAAGGSSLQIGLLHFGQNKETVLDVLPVQSGAHNAYATVSDRPDVVFELPVKPDAAQDMVSIAQLPLTVNELRSATLTKLNVPALRGIQIVTERDQIDLVRQNTGLWMIQDADGNQRPANRPRLVDLLTAVTDAKVAAFVTDAAVDFAPWGLDHPSVLLRFVGENNALVELAFGKDKEGSLFMNRKGTSSVVRVNPEILAKIATQSYQWRDSLVWSVGRIDIASIERTIPNRPPPFRLDYDGRDGAWKAQREGKDVTGELNPNRADYLLAAVEKLDSSRWLPPDDADAASALATPAMTLTVAVRRVDEQGDFKDLRNLTLQVAQTGPPGGYYARVLHDVNPFVLDRETVQKLTVEVFDATR